MTDIELKACPYCGSGDKVRMWSSPKYGRPIFVVECKGCDAGGPSSMVSKERAAELWNRRPLGADQ